MISKNQLRQVIYEQRQRQLGDTVPREMDYKLIECPEVLVISGVRRCGKSVLLQQIRSKRKDQDYYLNFDDERLINFTVDDFQLLTEVFAEEFGTQSDYYLDEIQNVKGWERFVSRLYGSGAKVFITGSNANLLSRELGTFLTGRHVTHTLYPFSYGEYLKAKGIEVSRDMLFTTQGRSQLLKQFREYLTVGGFPQYVFSENTNYLSAFYNDIIYKDVLVRNRLTNEQQIRELMFYLASNATHRFTYNSLAKQAGIKSAETAKAYVSYLEGTYIIVQLQKYDHSLGVQLRSPKKAYCIDNAIINKIGFNVSENLGNMLENAVYIELQRRGADTYYYAGTGECDFIVRDGYAVRAAVQVTVSMQDEKTRKREISGVVEVMQTFSLKEGLIITLEETEELEIPEAGTVHVVPAWRWMLQGMDR